MPTSKVTRVRNDGFSKIMASVLPFSASEYASGIGLDLARYIQEALDLLRRKITNRQEILPLHAHLPAPASAGLCACVNSSSI